MLAGAFPNEMPRKFRIDPDGTASVAGGSFERASVRSLNSALAVNYRIGIISGRGRHESNAKKVAIGRITEALDVSPISSIDLCKRSAQGRIEERIADVKVIHFGNYFDVVISLH